MVIKVENKDDILTQSIQEPIQLRAHHGMCLAYFTGHGYSSDFTNHMQQVLEHLKKGATVRLAAETDIICSACPNNIDGVCEKPDLVLRYDTEVLARCGLSEGEEVSFADFSALVKERILAPGLRGEICGGCQWNGICVDADS